MKEMLFSLWRMIISHVLHHCTYMYMYSMSTFGAVYDMMFTSLHCKSSK